MKKIILLFIFLETCIFGFSEVPKNIQKLQAKCIDRMLSSVIVLHKHDISVEYRIISKACYNAVYDIKFRGENNEQDCKIILDAIPMLCNEHMDTKLYIEFAELQKNTMVLLWTIKNYYSIYTYER